MRVRTRLRRVVTDSRTTLPPRNELAASSRRRAPDSQEQSTIHTIHRVRNLWSFSETPRHTEALLPARFGEEAGGFGTLRHVPEPAVELNNIR